MKDKLIENRSLGLDFIRALAIVLVIIAHFAKCLELFGFWGVELFFGLSGYLIGQILWRNYNNNENWNFKNINNFWLRRWWRTLPNYFLFFLISFPFHFYIMGDKIPDITKLLPFLFFSQNLLSRYGGFYGVSWSLCIEEWLYFLFPIILFFFHTIIRKKTIAYTFTLITFLLGSIISRAILKNNGQAEFLRTITFCRLDSIAYGIAIAFIECNIQLSNRKKVLYFWFGIFLILSPLFLKLLTNETFAQLRQNSFLLVTVPIGSSLIIPFLATSWKTDFINRSFKIIITKLSLWTYSIYLSHIPILFTVYYFLSKFRSNTFLNFITKVIGLSLTLIISSLIYNYFERPLTRKRPREV